MKNNNDQKKKFPGFPPEPKMNFWSYPKDLNGYWHQLSGSEQKVLDYILRHTWGFDKISDEISLTQIEKGIKKKDDGWFDKGTGLSRPTIITAIKGLIEKGFVSKKPGEKANCYDLVKDFNHPSKKSLPIGSKKTLHTIDNNTINNKQYNFPNKKPYYNEMLMRNCFNKWQVLRDGEWTEFAGKESEIEWK